MDIWKFSELASLGMTLLGTVLLFHFSFPRGIDFGGLNDNPPSKTRYSPWAWVGLLLLIASLVVQAVRVIFLWT